MIGAYPGTFDPPTVAHLAIAEASVVQGGLDEVHLVVSRRPLGKAPSVPSFEERIAVLETVAATRTWLQVRVSSGRLIAEVVAGYDAVVMGMDKWLQVTDPAWYEGSEERRDAAVAGLPRLILADRQHMSPSVPIPPDSVRLEIPAWHRDISSTAARAGRTDWMAPEAARFDAITGGWSKQTDGRTDGGIYQPGAPAD